MGRTHLGDKQIQDKAINIPELGDDVLALFSNVQASPWHYEFLDASANVITYELPDPTTIVGNVYVIKKIDTSTNKITIKVVNGLAIIDNKTSHILKGANDSVTIKEYNNLYYII